MSASKKREFTTEKNKVVPAAKQQRAVMTPGELDETQASSDSGPFAPLCGNLTSRTKTEVYYVLHCRQRRTEPRPSTPTATGNIRGKFGEIWMRGF